LARKKRGKNKMAKFSLGDLQRMVQAKLAEIEKLRARREALAEELADLDTLLAAAGGPVSGGEPGDDGAVTSRSATSRRSKRRGRRKAPRQGKRRGRRAGKQGQSDLHNAIRAVLKRSEEPVKLADIATAVRKSGYKTKSANFRVILGQRIPEMNDVKRVGLGMYAMK